VLFYVRAKQPLSPLVCKARRGAGLASHEKGKKGVASLSLSCSPLLASQTQRGGEEKARAGFLKNKATRSQREKKGKKREKNERKKL
jgi:hypothetical protein